MRRIISSIARRRCRSSPSLHSRGGSGVSGSPSSSIASRTVRLASLPMRPLSAYNGEEGTYHARRIFHWQTRDDHHRKSDWMPFPLTLMEMGNQLSLVTGGKSFTFGPLLATTHDDVAVWSLHSHQSRKDKVSFTLERSLLSWPTFGSIS